MDDYIFCDGFDRLELSKKNKSILKKMSIHNVDSLVNTSRKEIIKKLSTLKLTNFQDEFLSFYEKSKKEFLFSEKEFRNRAGLLCHDLRIEYLSLSKKVYNFLKKIHIDYISDLINMDDKQFTEFDGIGEKSVNEIISLKNKISLIVDTRVVRDKGYDNFSKISISIINDIRIIKDINGAEIFNDIYGVLESEVDSFDHDIYLDESFYQKLAKKDFIKEILEVCVLQAIKKSVDGASLEQILLYVPKGFNTTSILCEILNKLENNKQIFFDDNVYKIQYCSIYEYIDTITNEIHRKILLDRLVGKTLEEIGTEVNLTRERVRQIIVKLFDKRPLVAEDAYVNLYTKCCFEKEDFLIAFDVGEYVYNYLNACYTKGKKSAEECLKEEQLNMKEREIIKKILHKDYLIIGSEYVKAQRCDLCEYTVRTYAEDDITYEDFVQHYYSLIKDLGLDEERYSIEGRGYENKLVSSDYILWKYGKRFRYYKLTAYDFDELIDTLNLDKYMNLEISTLLLFKNNVELMDTYDIRDEYELHNLLKKVIKNTDDKIKFHRMPNIEIGNADRAKQVMDLLVLNAPIKNVELAKKYEEIYGVSEKTVLADYFKEISIYCHDSIYKMDYPTPSNGDFEYIKRILVDDFYMITNVKEILASKMPSLNFKFVNCYVLKKVGFRVYTNYMIKDSYQSATDYFRKLLLKQDVLDLRCIPRELINLSSFQSELAFLKSEYEVIEYLPSKYINFSKLKANNITKQDLMEYSNFIYSNVKDGDYFTISLLKNKHIDNDFGRLGFDNVFYASILSERKEKFQFRRIGGNKLFIKGSQKVYLSNFIEYILSIRELLNIDIDDLINILKDSYSIILEKHKVIELIKGTNISYDELYHKIFINYSCY